MENSAAGQLPEVDSLPDGFVESPAEVLAPQTPTSEQESLRSDYKEDSVLNKEAKHESLGASEEASEVKPGRTEKMRTFPVLLSERDGTESSGQSTEVPCGVSVIGGSAASGQPESVDSDGAPPVVDEKLSTGLPNLKEQVEVKYGAADRSITGGLVDSSNSCTKETPASERADIVKKKKQEVAEIKRKNAKRTLMSEKEFLEFTLKYQQVIEERDSAITVRDKLESLCRELQRQNKVLMDECKRVSVEGQNLRLGLSTSFDGAIKDIKSKLEEQRDECLSQTKENKMLKSMLKELSDQYSASEQKFNQKIEQKSLQMKQYAEQVSQLLATEKNLRSQLTNDGEKFQQFQDALVKSNEVFETFKQEIEKMAKCIKELKKENLFLKGKCEKTDVTLIQLVEEREHLKKQLEKAKGQKDKLESLCRSLQAERKQNAVGS